MQKNNQIAIIDCEIAGISGDMFLGALLDLGAETSKVINAIKSLESYIKCKNLEVKIKDVLRSEIRAKKIDVTAENVEGRDHHLARSKGADTFCPIGPWIDTEFDSSDARIEAYQNEKLIRQGNLSNRIWKDEQVLQWLSQWMTLDIGDIILTGTPPRVTEKTFLNDGDIFEVKIEGLGSLKNRFVCRKNI
jgi:hypothetical protein